MAVAESKETALAIAGITVIVLIAGLTVSLSAESTGNIVTYKYSMPERCYSTPEETCLRQMHCKTWERGMPVEPQPADRTPPGYIACRCSNQPNPDTYKYFLICQ